VQPKNTKLEDRARRIVAEAAGVDYDRAVELLTQARGNVKTAIVMARLGVDRESAEARLSAAGGRVANALER
jgi:N-acetylmuramic acid 6-phosphate etherase